MNSLPNPSSGFLMEANAPAIAQAIIMYTITVPIISIKAIPFYYNIVLHFQPVTSKSPPFHWMNSQIIEKIEDKKTLKE
ncbi:hypothetical protein NCCP2378_05190 [Sporosarcina sp. NCCP-2378]|nr:hypothetical protein NCCP2378_05190 [Sporosarcina sp. NCCP-2378]